MSNVCYRSLFYISSQIKMAENIRAYFLKPNGRHCAYSILLDLKIREYHSDSSQYQVT